MKLFIIYEENDDKIEMNINEYLMVRDIRYKLDEKLGGNGTFTMNYYRLVHNNFILHYEYSIKHYKICENDEIWFGKIENYLRKDDVIIHVFILGRMCTDEYFIVKMNDTISTIRSIIERIHSEIINIWNLDGDQIQNDRIATEITTNVEYKLIIRCDDGEGNETDKTFDECCFSHDKRRVDRCLFWFELRDDNKNESTRKILKNLINEIGQIISSNNTNDDQLNQNLSDFPTSYLNSTNFFCFDMMSRILNICNDYWKHVMSQYDNEAVRIFEQYFHIAIRAALWNYSNLRHNYKNKNKSKSDIVFDALHYFKEYLIDSIKDWRFWLELWKKQYLLRDFSDCNIDKRIDEHIKNKFRIKIRSDGKDVNYFIPFNIKSIIKAKQSISKALNIEIKHLYCIRPGGDYKPTDEEDFDDEIIIEIVLSMADIEILGKIGKGAFAEIILCHDKTYKKKFVLKKAIQKDEDIYRNINIYSKLNASTMIMNYFRLFIYKEKICIGMEYMSEGSLISYLKKVEHLSEQEIVKIAFEILKQINELHKSGIIHRDIKSDNIVLDKDNHAKLIDFGTSKYTIGLTSKDLLDKLKAYAPGTIYYMAPELIKEEPYSEKIDIWSFGMVMVEMVTGERPFCWLEPFQVAKKIKLCTKYKFESKFPISNELNQFICSCLNTNPDERPSAEQLINSEFINCLNNKIII